MESFSLSPNEFTPVSDSMRTVYVWPKLSGVETISVFMHGIRSKVTHMQGARFSVNVTMTTKCMGVQSVHSAFYIYIYITVIDFCRVFLITPPPPPLPTEEVES